MADEYIRKQDAVNIAESYEVKIDGFCLDDYEYGRDQVAHSIANDLEDIAAVNVVPVVHGEWIYDGHHRRCNRCGTYFCNTDREGDIIPNNFCPNCGADMRGVQDE